MWAILSNETQYEILVFRKGDDAEGWIKQKVRKNYGVDNKISLPGYDAEVWLGLSNVQNLDYGFVVAFWKMYNNFLLNLIEHIAPVHMKNRWETEDGKAYALGFLIEDDFDHIKSYFQMFIDRQREIERSKGV